MKYSNRWSPTKLSIPQGEWVPVPTTGGALLSILSVYTKEKFVGIFERTGTTFVWEYRSWCVCLQVIQDSISRALSALGSFPSCCSYLPVSKTSRMRFSLTSNLQMSKVVVTSKHATCVWSCTYRRLACQATGYGGNQNSIYKVLNHWMRL